MASPDQTPALRLKILGEDGVGKKSFIHRCCGGGWVADTKKAIVDNNFLTKDMPVPFSPDFSLPVQVFDVSPLGADRSVTITSLRGFQGILVCYDLTRFSTFANLANFMRLVRNATSKGRSTALPLVIVGLKLDQTRDIAVTKEQMSQASAEFQVPHFAASSLNGEGVNEAFAKICELMFEDNRAGLLHYLSTLKPVDDHKKSSSLRALLRRGSEALERKRQPHSSSASELELEDPRDYSKQEEATVLARLQAVIAVPLPELTTSTSTTTITSAAIPIQPAEPVPPLSLSFLSLTPESRPSSRQLSAQQTDLSYFIDTEDKESTGEPLQLLADQTGSNLDAYIDFDDISDGGKSVSVEDEPPLQTSAPMSAAAASTTPSFFTTAYIPEDSATATASPFSSAAEAYKETTSSGFELLQQLQREASPPLLLDLNSSPKRTDTEKRRHRRSKKDASDADKKKKKKKKKSSSSSTTTMTPPSASTSSEPRTKNSSSIRPTNTLPYARKLTQTNSLNIPPTIYNDLNNRHQLITGYLAKRRAAGILDAADKDFQLANLDLIDLKLDFLSTVKTYGRVIICERYLPFEQKTVKPKDVGGAAGGEKYIVNNVLFKFAVDSHGIYGSEYAAMKVAGHELKGLGHYAQCNIAGLDFPMLCLIDYLGFRVIAMTMLPLGPESLKYGSPNGGATVMHDKVFDDYMKIGAEKLNLRKHLCGVSGVLLHSACDIEGHLGSDGRHYLLDFSRSMPPTYPDPRHTAGHLYNLFRSEFVAIYPKPLCPDSFSGFVRHDPDKAEYNNDIQEATQNLFDKVIPVNAIKILLSIKEAFSLDEIRSFSLSYEFHRQGINMRYLGKVLRALVDRGETGPAVAYIFLEVVARVVKNGLRRRLRKQLAALRIPLEAPYSRIIVHYLNQVFTESPRADTYHRNSAESAWVGIASWAERAFYVESDSLTKLFPPNRDVGETIIPLDCHRQLLSYNFGTSAEKPLTARYLLYQRIAELTGVRFSPGSIARLNSSAFSKFAPFSHQDFEQHGMRIKCLPPLSTCQAVNVLSQVRMGQYDNDGALQGLEIARRTLAAASAGNPLHPELLHQLALVLVTEHDFQGGSLASSEPKAIAIDQLFQTAISQWAQLNTEHPALAEANYHYARFLTSVQRWRRAEDYFLRALEINPLLPTLWNGYIRFLESVYALSRSPNALALSQMAKERLAEIHRANWRRDYPVYQSLEAFVRDQTN